jgi:hypothetical protein
MKQLKLLVFLLVMATAGGLGAWYLSGDVSSENYHAARFDECPMYGTVQSLLLAKNNKYLSEVSQRTEEFASHMALEPLSVNVPRRTLIDDYIFDKMEADNIPHADLASDEEFIRRLYLDVTGRIPPVSKVREFLESASPTKRDDLIDDLLYGTQSDQFIDKMTLWFGDLFRNEFGGINRPGTASGGTTLPVPGRGNNQRNAYYAYLRGFLEENRPYDQVAREVIAATGNPNTAAAGQANFLMRERVGLPIVDTCDNLANATGRIFLGTTFDCIGCHSGARHLEEINLWLATKTRSDLWGLSAFFSGARLPGQQGPGPIVMGAEEPCDTRTEVCEDLSTQGYNTREPRQENGMRPPRISPEQYILPKYLPTGETVDLGVNLRRELARIVTADPQFAKATVNYLWKEFMVVGIVDPPYAFDFARLDTDNPPPDPWTIQPSHPELLAALADEFRTSGYDLRHMVELILKSSAYQLSARFSGVWQESYAKYFARHFVKRLQAEQLHDSIVAATGVPNPYNVNLSTVDVPDNTVRRDWAVQLPSPSDPVVRPPGAIQNENELREEEGRQFLNQFERGDRMATIRPEPRGSLTQIMTLMNRNYGAPATNLLTRLPETVRQTAFQFVDRRVRSTTSGSLVQQLAESNRTDTAKVDELFLSTLSRHPTDPERERALKALANGTEGLEDLHWALLNKLDFILY